MDWQTLLLIIGIFAGLEGVNLIVSTATAGAIDINRIAYDCSPERLVCPQTGFVNGTRVQCNIFGCYEEPIGIEFTGYYSYDYAQKWDTDYGSTYVPILAEASGYQSTKHLCILNLNIGNEVGESFQIDQIIRVPLTVGGINHTFEFKPYSSELPPELIGDMDARLSYGVYHLGCYSGRQVIGNNTVMYSGIIEDRETCENEGEKKVLHALEADAWFPEGRYDCKTLNLYFLPVLLVLITAIPMIFSYYSASGMWEMTRYF